MAGDDNNAAANTSAAPGSYKVSLPLFNGHEVPIRADNYVRMVEQLAAINKWSSEATINAASLNLRETANTWAVVYFKKHPEVKDWKVFKQAFLERFHRKTTIADKQALISRLKQRPNEGVDDFMDRVHLTLADVDEFDDNQAVFFFLQGAKPELKKFLEQNKDLEKDEEFLEAGRAWERANKNALNEAYINALKTTEDVIPHTTSTEPTQSTDGASADATDTEEVNSSINALTESIQVLLRGRQKRGRGRGQGLSMSMAPRSRDPRNFEYNGPNNRGIGRGNSYMTAYSRPANRPGPKTPLSKANMECFRCKRLGHFERECRVPAHLIQALQESDEGPPPTEAAYTMTVRQPLN
jgi:hypothetical protein